MDEKDVFQRQLKRFDLKNGKNLLEKSLFFPTLVEAISGPYSQTIPIKLKGSKPVNHRETCPVCGSKLVNIYLKNREWKCKKCWDKEGESK